jgi:hypothetical protein
MSRRGASVASMGVRGVRPQYLRLVWSRPEPLHGPRARVDFAQAIERHLSGVDGLSDLEFVVLYATGLPTAGSSQR